MFTDPILTSEQNRYDILHQHMKLYRLSENNVSLKKRRSPPPQWTEKGGQEQFSDAESILSQRYVHYVGSSEI